MVNLWRIAECVQMRWSPAIGDPTILGWSVVCAYAVAAAAALAMIVVGTRHPRERAFWALVTVAMVALAINKQLDLQSALTAAGRCVAQAQGWYAQRRGVQLVFIEGIAGLAVLLLLTALIAMRAHLGRLWPAILGLGFVLAYVAIRAAGFHHVDRLIATRVAGLRANPLLELGGILLIQANAAVLLLGRLRLRRSRAHSRTRAHR